MQTTEPSKGHEFGLRLVDSISIPEERLNTLFAAIFLTSVGVFAGCNLLLMDVSVLQRSTPVALACFALLLVFYTLSRSTHSVLIGLALTYGLMWTMVYSRQTWLVPAGCVAALAALGYVARHLRVKRTRWTDVLLMAIIATATILGVAGAYTSFDMLNRLYAGNVHQDTLFHASIAAMIKNYGVTSTGLDGLVETPYHVLSHVLFANVSQLSGVGVIEVYGVATSVLFAPILVLSAVACLAMLDQEGQVDLPVAWGATCVLLVASPFLLWRWAVWDSFFVSESYLVSLGLFLLGFPLLFKRRLALIDLLAVLVLTALVSGAKSPVGLIFSGLWLARVLFVRSEHFKYDVAALALSAAAAAWAVAGAAGAASGAISISPLHFIREYALLGDHVSEVARALQAQGGWSSRSVLLALAAIVGFFTFHFFLAWVLAAHTAYRKGILAALQAPLCLYALATTLAGVLVVMLLGMPGGSEYYITNVAFFVALPGVAALLARAAGQRAVPGHLLLVSGILLISLLQLRGYYAASKLSPAHSVTQHSSYVDSLIELRHSAPLNVVMQPEAEAFAHNPVSRCSAQPFVYPALSERPWVNVIAARRDCAYEHYGYEQYGITPSQQSVTVQPQIPPGMSILRWPKIDRSQDTPLGLTQ